MTMRLAKEVQLILLCCLLLSVDKSCKALHNVKYVSSNTTRGRRLHPFQIFLNKLALICDQQRGGNTITALVALKGSNGPAYHFASNNRQEEELKETKTFLTKLLGFVGTNPDRLAEKPLQKQVLWRILEFNYQRVDHYVRSVVNTSSECTAQRNEPVTPAPSMSQVLLYRHVDSRMLTLYNAASDMIKQLVNIGHKAQISHEMLLNANAKTKCESATLLKSFWNTTVANWVYAQSSKTASLSSRLYKLSKMVDTIRSWMISPMAPTLIMHFLGVDFDIASLAFTRTVMRPR